jgi:hypothetical protein
MARMVYLLYDLKLLKSCDNGKGELAAGQSPKALSRPLPDAHRCGPPPARIDDDKISSPVVEIRLHLAAVNQQIHWHFL